MKKIASIEETVKENNRTMKEILWAQVFESARPAYKWLNNQTAFRPGRWELDISPCMLCQ